MDIIIFILLSLVISYYMYKMEELTAEASAFTFIISSSMYLCGKYLFFVLLLVFFYITNYAIEYKRAKKEDMFNLRNKRRDITQIAVHELPLLIVAILYLITKENVFIVSFCIIIAACASDTAAGEIGIFSKKEPISITKFKKVERGASGGVSWLGILVSFIVSLLIAGIYVLFNLKNININILYDSIAILVGGIVSPLIDSILGDTIQLKYIDNKTNSITEKKNNDGVVNKRIKGIVNGKIIDFISPLITIAIYLLIKIK